MPTRDEQAELDKLFDRISPSLSPAESTLLSGLIKAAPQTQSPADIAAETMVALQREISSRLLVLAEIDPAGAARVLAKVKSRIEAVGQLVLDFGQSGRIAPDGARKIEDRAIMEALSGRTARTLRREYVILQLFKLRTNQNMLEAHVILSGVKRIEPDVRPNTLTKHLTTMGNFGLLKSGQKGQWGMTPLGATYRDLIPGQLKALGGETPEL
jgi:hypothetical protein